MFTRISALGAVSLAVVAFSIACSSSSSQSASDSGTGGSTLDASGTPDVAGDVVADVASEADSPALSCPEGTWSDITPTNCDPIAQNCGQGLTCVPYLASGVAGTECTFKSNGLAVKGQTCTAQPDCAPGLLCVLGHCTPFCCPEIEQQVCGTGGQCNLSIEMANTTVLACTYLSPCTLWAHDCPANEACQPTSSDGSAACVPPSGSSFKNEGDACTAKNDCGDDQMCSSSGVCRYLCKNGTSPFDAGSLDAGAGNGGCPQGQQCGALSGQPSWLGVCQPP